MGKRKKIYYASGCGFDGERKPYMTDVMLPLMSQVADVVDPWRIPPQEWLARIDAMKRYSPEYFAEIEKMNNWIFEHHVKDIPTCDGLVANLNGDVPDTGVCTEIGLAFAFNLPMVGYRDDFRPRGDNDCLTVNLMPQKCIEYSGGRIVKKIDALVPAMIDVFRI